MRRGGGAAAAACAGTHTSRDFDDDGDDKGDDGDDSRLRAWRTTGALALPAGYYTWAIETTDADSVVDKDLLSGTQQITIDPHA